MSFAILSTLSVLLGIAALAIVLFLAQRLRVQHREVEVLSTIFWQQALEETRARVFVRRFRHWWAWVLLLAIASLLWILLASPNTHSLDGTRHVVLVDWGINDEQIRQDDLALAIKLAGLLPTNDREIVAVSTQLETLLRPGEPLELARLRSETEPEAGPRDLNWAIEALAVRVRNETPLLIHVIGDTPVDQSRLDWLNSIAGADGKGKNRLQVQRVERQSVVADPMLATLGIDDAVGQSWGFVDLWIAIAKSDLPSSATAITVSKNGLPVTKAVTRRRDGIFEIKALPADGSTIEVALHDRPVGVITLPLRTAIRVQVEADVPETLRQLIELDQACEIVSTDADVTIGSSSEASFRLTADDEPAFAMTADNENPEEALADLVDRLALQQIDATGIAQASGRVVDVQVSRGDQRTVAIWKSLFSSSFDFQESRACPMFVARSIRWLADRPPLVPWAELGQRLPESAPEFQRVMGQQTMTNDGRTLRATRLAAATAPPATLVASQFGSPLAGISPITWLGLLLSMLLLGEWVLYQRGHIP